MAIVVHVLLQWLNQLPEPLLGFDHYDVREKERETVFHPTRASSLSSPPSLPPSLYQAILACQEVEDVSHRIRNIGLLVQETAWYNKPLLIKLLLLLHKCVQPEHTATNKLNVYALSIVCTPILLRPNLSRSKWRGGGGGGGGEESDEFHMAAVAAGALSVQFLIERQGEVFNAIRFDLTQRQNALAAKCGRIRQLQEELTSGSGINTVFTDAIDEEGQSLIRELWKLLEAADKMVAFSPQAADSPQSGEGGGVEVVEVAEMSIADILNHGRWERCGLVAEANIPLQDFNSKYGHIALKSLVGFIKR